MFITSEDIYSKMGFASSLKGFRTFKNIVIEL